jgi:peptide/histidine transporter 3/4
MIIVALGAGGIKPCVASFGGDQYREDSAVERGWRSKFFNWYCESLFGYTPGPWEGGGCPHS